MPPLKPRALLFDLDGTLIDSTRDIAAALNHALRALGRDALPDPIVRGFIGDGLPRLVARGLTATGGGADDDGLMTSTIARARDYYGGHATEHTRVYPGIPELLDALGVTPMAVVSNKPEGLCRVVLAELGLAARFRVVIGGDTLPQCKPDPAPLVHALERLMVSREGAVMVGDGPQDVEAARNAAVTSIAVTYGIADETALAAAKPDHTIRSVPELRTLLLG